MFCFVGSLGFLRPAPSETRLSAGPEITSVLCPGPGLVALQPSLSGCEQLLMTPGASPLGCVPLQSSVPSPGPAEGLVPARQCWAFTFATEPQETDTHSFRPPKLEAVMNSYHSFPKPQHSEHLPEQAGAFPEPCPSQPISWRRPVPQLYSGKCSLSLRLPVLSRAPGLRARPSHRASSRK